MILNKSQSYDMSEEEMRNQDKKIDVAVKAAIADAI
jgi:hypothetical protein